MKNFTKLKERDVNYFFVQELKRLYDTIYITLIFNVLSSEIVL